MEEQLRYKILAELEDWRSELMDIAREVKTDEEGCHIRGMNSRCRT